MSFLSPSARSSRGKGHRFFYPGTTMLFYQGTAPAGWTKLIANNDKALRVVNGAGGVAGGTNSFSSVMAQTVIANTTLSAAQLPSHPHPGVYPCGWGNGQPGSGAFCGDGNGSAGWNGAGGGGAHNHSILMSIQYVDIILASKN
jgi:hypothetical protein